MSFADNLRKPKYRKLILKKLPDQEINRFVNGVIESLKQSAQDRAMTPILSQVIKGYSVLIDLYDEYTENFSFLLNFSEHYNDLFEEYHYDKRGNARNYYLFSKELGNIFVEKIKNELKKLGFKGIKVRLKPDRIKEGKGYYLEISFKW